MLINPLTSQDSYSWQTRDKLLNSEYHDRVFF
jgi:hypothetical protein